MDFQEHPLVHIAMQNGPLIDNLAKGRREIFMAELSEDTQPFGCRMRMKPITSEIDHHQIRRKHIIAAPRFLNTPKPQLMLDFPSGES